MFQSFDYIKGLGYNRKKGRSKHKYLITDSGFRAEGIVKVFGGPVIGLNAASFFPFVGAAVIDTYEKLHLPVAYNLMLAILYIHNQHKDFSIKHITEMNQARNPKFAEYEKDIEKYLVLI